MLAWVKYLQGKIDEPNRQLNGEKLFQTKECKKSNKTKCILGNLGSILQNFFAVKSLKEHMVLDNRHFKNSNLPQTKLGLVPICLERDNVSSQCHCVSTVPMCVDSANIEVILRRTSYKVSTST